MQPLQNYLKYWYWFSFFIEKEEDSEPIDKEPQIDAPGTNSEEKIIKDTPEKGLCN